MIKKFIAVIAVSVGAISLAGCGSSSEPVATSAELALSRGEVKADLLANGGFTDEVGSVAFGEKDWPFCSVTNIWIGDEVKSWQELGERMVTSQDGSIGLSYSAVQGRESECVSTLEDALR